MSHTSLYGLNIGQKPLDLIQTVKKSAMYYWESLLPACGIDIPAKGKHGACPVCGGTDRFHFIDDHHNGNWHCRQCENPKYGDGLDLVARTKGISITEAAKVIADVLALPLPDQTRYVGDGSGIKAITGGDEVSIDPKHKQPYSTRIPAVVLAVNNNAMSFSDRSGGVSRRRVIFNFSEVVPEHERDPFLRDKIAEELPVIIQHLLHRFSDPKEARRLLAEQQKSEEALTIKRGTDSLVDFCGYLIASNEADGMLIGNAEIMPFNPRKYLYHSYLAYMKGNNLNKPVSVTRFGMDMPGALAEYGLPYLRKKSKQGIRSNMSLNIETANEWMPKLTREDQPEE